MADPVSKDSKHVLGEPESVTAKGKLDRAMRWVVACSCGYTTDSYIFRNHALKVAQQHREAMEPPVYGVFGEGG